MISQELLDNLRCPVDPARQTALVLHEERLLCPRCGLKFPIKDGFPVLVVEEAELPAGCESLDQLPGRHDAKAS
jgi:uncharacterized protein YbaR (Trm112 family)